MAQQIDIVNIALARINASPIVSLNEQSKAARVARLCWDVSLDSTLRAHDWGFAANTARLALLDGKPYGWRYAYAQPHDCLVIRRLHPHTDHLPEVPTAPFAMRDHGGRGAVLCDVKDAHADYTMKIADCGRFDAQFTDALAFRLASDIALGVKADPEYAGAMFNFFEQKIQDAQLSNARENPVDDTMVSDFEKARWL